MYFVFRDTAWAVLCVYLANKFLSTSMPPVMSFDFVTWFVGWNLYAFWMGTVLTGHWVLAHECGHNAFSSSKLINDCVGYVLHQALLVPYFAWQYSHAKHHRRTNNLVDGEVSEAKRPVGVCGPSWLAFCIITLTPSSFSTLIVAVSCAQHQG